MTKSFLDNKQEVTLNTDSPYYFEVCFYTVK